MLQHLRDDLLHRLVGDDLTLLGSNTAQIYLAAVAEAAGDKKYLSDDTLTLTEDASSETISNNTSDTELSSWLFGDEAVTGATKVIENADTGYTVYYVTDAAHKPADSMTYSVRHILVKFPEDKDTADETEETAEKAEETAEEDVSVPALDTKGYEGVKIILDVDGDSAKDKATYVKAQNILQEYLEGEHPAVWEAWGNIVEMRPYLKDCLRDMANIGQRRGALWFTSGAISKKGHPHHPLYLKKDSALDAFDIETYLRETL